MSLATRLDRRARAGVPPPVAVPLPLDVRAMQAATRLVWVGLVLLLLAGGLLWLAQRPAMTISRISLQGDHAHLSRTEVLTSVVPQLKGQFLTMNLAAAQAAFEGLPWVRRAEVRRVWPGRLVVTLQEHVPVALWQQGEDEQGGDEKLVNSQGEIFDANLGELSEEDLPVLEGPTAESARLLATWQRLAPLFGPAGDELVRLRLSDRGSWLAVLASGAQVQLGRGEAEVLTARAARFVATVGAAVARQQAAGWASADLRHADGYALRLKAAARVE